jgi:twinkle protein
MRKGENEKSAPGKFDVKGAGEITDLADNIVIVWKNLTKPDEIIKAEQKAAEADRETALSAARAKPDAFVRIAKQRHHPWEGAFAFWFDKDSQQFLEGERAHPKHVELGEFDYGAYRS